MYQDYIYKLTPNEWEWFAQDVLFHLGFSVEVGPAEGVDDGVDLIATIERDQIAYRYLVSCKHPYKTKKNVGVRQELDIRDRVEQHDCNGFIAFYSVGSTSGLKKKLIALESKGIDIIELYLNEIMDIIPTMRGFILQKYFDAPHELYHHVVESSDYQPLICMNEACNKDLLLKENIPMSMAGFGIDKDKTVHFIYGCKYCVSDYCTHPYWAEISQIRYIEQMQGWNSIVEEVSNTEQLSIASDFYKDAYDLQSAILQIQIPQGWGRWI
ncbi:TPA: restriction endonuclease [Vibrio parahaemolyticus]